MSALMIFALVLPYLAIAILVIKHELDMDRIKQWQDHHSGVLLQALQDAIVLQQKMYKEGK